MIPCRPPCHFFDRSWAKRNATVSEKSRGVGSGDIAKARSTSHTSRCSRSTSSTKTSRLGSLGFAPWRRKHLASRTQASLLLGLLALPYQCQRASADRLEKVSIQKDNVAFLVYIPDCHILGSRRFLQLRHASDPTAWKTCCQF